MHSVNKFKQSPLSSWSRSRFFRGSTGGRERTYPGHGGGGGSRGDRDQIHLGSNKFKLLQGPSIARKLHSALWGVDQSAQARCSFVCVEHSALTCTWGLILGPKASVPGPEGFSLGPQGPIPGPEGSIPGPSGCIPRLQEFT